MAYSYIFRFGAFRLLDKKETPRPIQSLDDIQQKVREDTKADVDSFTKGTLELSDWLCSWYSEKKENTQNMLTRAKNVFSKSSEQPSQNPEDRKWSTAVCETGCLFTLKVFPACAYPLCHLFD